MIFILSNFFFEGQSDCVEHRLPGMTSGLTKKLIQETMTKSPEGR